MHDREKVMRGLEACNRQSYNGSDCQNCPYYDDEDTAELPFGICNIQDMFDDALALLKEQEARVMKREEVDESRGVNVWVEIYSPRVRRFVLIYCAVRRSETLPAFYNFIEDSGVIWVRIDKGYNYNVVEFFGIRNGWRCWTARPTEEQRKAAAWL